ncbi:hypothetical protein [Photobacterium nomapromontoriensis]|uniref:hypothetical protein n=1 Tax=Photobacterium nomapromontoriensis TaxID=2910237 RepID=UPI003D11DD77
MKFIKTLQQRGEIISITLVMVYRKSNYLEIPEFIEMGRAFNANYLVIHPVQPWKESAYVLNDQYNDEAIHNPEHPEHHRFRALIESHGITSGNQGKMYVDFSK